MGSGHHPTYALGMPTMFGFLLFLLLFLFVATPVVATLFLVVAWQSRREWALELAGRRIEIRNRLLSVEVWVDGARVPAAVSHRTLSSSVVSCTLEGTDGRAHQLTTSIDGDGWFGVVGHVFVDGRYAGGDPLPPDDPPPQGLPAGADPDDPRWQAATQLAAGVRAHGDAEAREAATQVQAALRQALDDLAHLDAVKDAHRTVARVAGDDAEQRLQGVLALQEERVRALLSALSDLHLAALARTGTQAAGEAVSRAREVLGKLSADAEVERAVHQRAEAERRLAQRSREKAG